MKIVSPLHALLLLLLPGAQAFTTRVAPVVSPRGVSRSGTATKLAVGLFQPEIDSPNKQELLNNRHSASDWLYNVKSMPSSQVLREIRNPVLSVFGWAVFVSVAQRLLLKSRNAALQTIASKITIPATAHSFLVSAIGLLLVFRTNSAYQRFYEGRKIWEHILSLSRNLTRSIQLYSKEVGPERRQRMTKLVAAFPYLLRHHIRSGCLCDNDYGKIDPDHRLLLREPALLAVETRHDGDKQCFGGTTKCKEMWRDRRECWVDRRKLPWSLFPESALLKVAKARNRPLWVCDRIGRELMSVTFTENYTTRERSALIAYVDKLSDAMGECERIHQTAVPLNYARHSLRSLTLWLFTLPFALIKDLGLLTGPVTACVAWLLFGVYQVSIKN
jgi:predicted membrane chloride channel (bestrophin family)